MRKYVVHAVTCIAVCIAIAGALNGDAPTSGTDSGNASAALVTTGHTLFITNCAPCHGAQAEGDDGPNLHNLGLPDDAISSTITTGVKGQMPSFAKKLKDGNLKAVVAYVHSLQ